MTIRQNALRLLSTTHSTSPLADAASDNAVGKEARAAAVPSPENKADAIDAHTQAVEAHTNAAARATRSGDKASAKYHQGKADEHSAKALSLYKDTVL
jgi:hypothetical protein